VGEREGHIRSLISSIKGRGLGSTGAIEHNNQKRIELDNGTYLLVLVYLCSRLWSVRKMCGAICFDNAVG